MDTFTITLPAVDEPLVVPIDSARRVVEDLISYLVHTSLPAALYWLASDECGGRRSKGDIGPRWSEMVHALIDIAKDHDRFNFGRIEGDCDWPLAMLQKVLTGTYEEVVAFWDARETA